VTLCVFSVILSYPYVRGEVLPAAQEDMSAGAGAGAGAGAAP
jgi:hypothetical protein